ncbi:hypothetical protein HK102_012359 [Quaeritorhiza haematococci]|nr:hypothetical protein HK102_012359 [Quaeritorhiza haematococci]
MERCGDLEQHRFEFHLRMENPFASRRDLINYRLITPESWPIPNEPRSIHDGQKWTVNGWVPKKHQPKLKHQPADLKMPPVFERLVEDGNNKIKEKEEARPSSGPANESTADEEFRFKRKKPPPHMGELISTLSEPKKYPPPLTHRHHELEEHLGLLEKLRQKTARPFDRQVVERLAQPKVWVQPEWIPPKPPKFKRIKRRPVPSIGATQSEPEPSSEGQEEQVDGDTAEENALKVENLDDSVAGGNEEGSGEPQDDGRVAKPAEENASAYDEAQSETRDPVQSDVDAQEANSSSDNKEVPAENGELSVNVSHDEDEKKAEGEVEHADKRAEEPDQMTIVADSSTGNNNTTVTPQADEKSTESDLEQHASDPAKVSDPQEGDGSPAAISNQVPRSVDGQEAAPPTQVDAAPLQAPMPEDQRTEEQPAPETNTQDQPAPNQPALQEPATDPETKSEDQAAQEQSVQETTNQDQLTAEQLSQEQAVQETVTQDQPTAEQPAPDSGATADAPIDVPVATENNEVVVQPVAETKRQVANQPQTENEAPETNTSDTNANHPSQEKEATVGVESESGVKATEGLDQTTGEATAESSAENATVTVTSEDQTVTAAETTEAKEVEEAEVAAPNNQEEKGETETAM